MTKMLSSRGIYYIPNVGGIWIKWNGSLEGHVYYTFSRYTAHSPLMNDQWMDTLIKGKDANCRAKQVELVLNYLSGI
jgi:hypothetical protein